MVQNDNLYFNLNFLNLNKFHGEKKHAQLFLFDELN